MYSKEARKVIAVDLDQTLAHTLSSLCQWHNDTYFTQLDPTQFDTCDYWKIWGGTREESYLKIRDFYDSYHFDHIEPINDFALEALKMLKRRHFTLVIITSRQQFVAEKTKKFVDKHYPGIFESIYFCNLDLTDAEQLEYVSKPKSVICQEIGVDVLIDDCLEHANDCAALGIDVLLYDLNGTYAWNHHKKETQKRTLTSTSKNLYQQQHYSNVQRMSSWKEIIAQFPKPTSPLRYCYFPEEEEEEEEEDTSIEDEDELFDNQSNYYKYETIEVEEMSEEEEDTIMWKDNRVWV